MKLCSSNNHYTAGPIEAPLTASIVKIVISSVVKDISGRKNKRAGRGYMNKKF